MKGRNEKGSSTKKRWGLDEEGRRSRAGVVADGAFTLKGLFPSSAYVVKPWSDKWNSKTEEQIDSAPQGETAVLPKPLQIKEAYSKKSGSKVIDLATGAVRFEVSTAGVITDSQTKLEWIVGPETNTNYAQAMQWVATSSVAGGGWRMPTRVELKTIYQQGVGERNMDPAFKTTGWYVWAEPNDSSSAWPFCFGYGDEDQSLRDNSPYNRVFGVRSRPR